MKEQKEIPKNFGIPEVNNTPMGIVGMEGNLFRGMGKRNKEHKMLVRVFAIFVSIMIFLLPGAMYLWLSMPGYYEGGLMNSLHSAMFGLLFFIAGVIGIYSNIRK
jgi:polyferredoxin